MPPRRRPIVPPTFSAHSPIATNTPTPSFHLTLADRRALEHIDRLFAIVGAGAARSRSPQLHNAAYRAAGVPALYLPLAGQGLADLLAAPVQQALTAIGLPLRGLTVGAPFKELALRLAADASPRARQAGAANLLLRQGDAWYADTTDPEGVLLPLADHQVALADREVAVIGCGGAGRAIAAALRDAGARVTLVNRSRTRGEFAAQLLGLPCQPLDLLRESQYTLIVHATPCADALPLDPTRLAAGTVLVDLVYRELPTPLVRAASDRGHLVIDGHAVLAAEVSEQYQRMIGTPLPTAHGR